MKSSSHVPLSFYKNPKNMSRKFSTGLSIVIPALNEEKNLARLLESIKNQNLADFEIIVADAGSRDKTKAVARKAGCRVVKGGLPARGRNAGAKSAKGRILLFLDADVILPPAFLEKSLKEFEKRKLRLASFFLVPEKGLAAKVLFFVFYNFPALVLEKFLPHAAMGIIAEKDLFQKTGGFNEQVTLAEDHYFARQASKRGKFGLIKRTRLKVSCRRFKKDGWAKTGLKYFFCELHLIFLGPVKKDMGYDFSHLKN